ncbi:MAG TPA: site-specific integrase, partial [Ignavibacteria bacterium]|nr:site-specific integrase [Ignavibacteria bacterium]
RLKLDKASAVTAHNHKRFLIMVFNKAIDWDIIKVNVAKKCVKIKLPEPDPVIFTKEDFKKLIEVTTMQKYKDLFTFAVLTGLRMNELIHLKSDQINVENKLIKVLSDVSHRTKTGRTRYVELNSLLLPIVHRLKEKEYPFAEFNKWMLKDAMNRYIRKAQINKRYSFKSFRSTCGKWLLDEGVNIKYISQMLGHSSVVTTEKHYAKYLMSEHKGWVDKVSI